MSALGQPRTRPLEERFWEKVDRRGSDECWLWTGARNEHGYGMIGVGATRKVKAHRLSLVLSGVEIEGLHVLHACDNPPCVNPAHLSVGTHQENMDECGARGRRAIGERIGGVRLTEAKVIAARDGYAAGATLQKLADEYGVNYATMNYAVSGRTWQHVPGAQVLRPRHMKGSA